MKDQIEKTKKIAERYLPIIVASGVIASVITAFICSRKTNTWTALVLNQETRDAMANSSDATVAFPEIKVMVLGKPWNP